MYRRAHRRSKSHDRRPKQGSLSELELKQITKRLSGAYSEYIKALSEEIKGKTVCSVVGGRSGYMLTFTDETWIVCYLSENIMDWMTGSGSALKEMQVINANGARDCSAPIESFAPYADEYCDISTEIKNAIGQQVTGVAIGEDSFNLCFPDNMELDAMVIHEPDGSVGLRVFWEQW